MMRWDDIYVVVRVGKKSNSYRLCKRKPKLEQNEFAYKLKITLDLKDWFDRIQEMEMAQPHPPNIPKPETIELLIEKDTPTKVMDRLRGEEDLK